MRQQHLILATAVLVATAAAQPIRLHPKNPHYFLFRGKTTALVTSAERYGAVLNTAFDYRRYLAAQAADGMNHPRIFGGSYAETPSKSFGIRRNTLAPESGRFLPLWARSETPGYEGGDNKFDLDRWNLEYFARLRDFLGEASRLGIVVELTFFTSHYQETHWKISPLNPANNVNGTHAIDWKKLHTLENGKLLARQESYVRKLAREPNVFDNFFFEIQNEPWSGRALPTGVVNPYLAPPMRDRYPNSIELADELSAAWQARVAAWIAGEEAVASQQAPDRAELRQFRFPVRELAPGVSIVNFHYAYPQAVTENSGLGKAVIYDETGFLGTGDDAYRRQAWNFMLSGGGATTTWTTASRSGVKTVRTWSRTAPGGGSPTLRRQLRVLSGFLHSLPLEDMALDPRTVKHAAGVHARALSNPGREYAMYFDGNGPAEVPLELPAEEYSGRWIDTRPGAVGRPERFAHRGGTMTLRSPEFRDGIALRLSRAAK